jgi:hypothetical protein
VAAKLWTARSDVVDALRKRWQRGEFLTALAEGRAVVPQAVPLRGPSAREVADRFGEVQAWVRRWEADSSGLRLEYVPVGGRLVGANRVPGRAWVDGEDRLWQLIGVRGDVAAFRQVLALTRDTYPELQSWVQAHPVAALAQAADWGRLLAVVRWIVDHGGPDVYLRQIDVPGVDTKFVETHRGLLGELLDTVLPPERIDPAVPYRRFAERYQLATKPAYVRFRSLDGQPLLPAVSEAASEVAAAPSTRNSMGPTELTFRVQEAGQLALPGRRVVIVENETTYLALPAMPDTLAVLGGGYGISAVAALPWLQEREVHYWGDLDTHGFAILDRLRVILPTVRSLLMDRTTLEGHRDHWGREPTPVNARLEHLTEPERLLYIDLIEDRYAPSLRLEQERIRFASVRCTLENLA